MRSESIMNYYSVNEAAEKIGVVPRRLYEVIRQVEETSPHQFGRMWRGHFYRGHKKKEKVISERDLLLIKQIYEVVNSQNKKIEEAIQLIFSPTVQSE